MALLTVILHAEAERRDARGDPALGGDGQRLDRHEHDGDRADDEDNHRRQAEHRMPARRRCADAGTRAHPVRGDGSGHLSARQRWSLANPRAATDAEQRGAALCWSQPRLEVDDGALMVGRGGHM